MDRPHSNQYNIDDVNEEKYIHTITFSIENDGNKHSFIKVYKKGRRPPSKNPYKVKPKKQLSRSLSQKL